MNANDPTSLLGDLPPELEAKLEKIRELEEQRELRAEALMKLLLESYRTGEIGFERYAKLCRVAIRTNVPDKPILMERWLGQAIAAALDADRKNPGRGNKGVPHALRTTALAVLEAIQEREGRPLSRTPGNAYERCCEVLSEGGFTGVTPSELERWRTSLKKTRK